MTQSTISNDVGVTAVERYFHKGSVSHVILLLKVPLLVCLGGLQGACQGAPKGSDSKLGTTFQ